MMTHTLRIMRSRFAQTGVLVGALMLFMGTNNDNGCAPDPGGQGECSTASDCAGDPGVDCVGNWACNSGECVFECGSEPVGCYGDQDCSGGLVCNAAEVCMSPPGCQPGAPCPAVCYGFCVAPEPPPTGCYSDGQCAAGQHCSVSDGACDPPPGCGPGQNCPAVCYGACVPDQGQGCWSDQECGAGEQCNTWDYCGGPAEYDADGNAGARQADYACMGQCEPTAPSCDSNDDCGPGEICGCGVPGMANGIVACLLQCIPDPNAQCSDTNPCDAGYSCQGGVCVEEQKGCWSDYDCAAGEQCNTWDYCVMPAGCAGANCLVACQGMCEPKPVACHDDSQCAANQHCEVMCAGCDCDPSFADCYCPETCSGTCVDDDPWQGCNGDADCGPNEYCGCGAGPYPGMPNGIMCMLQCVPKPYDCSSSAECESGQCNFVVCEDGGGVPEDPACDPADATCAAEKMPAPPYGQCYGYCEPPPAYDCQSDADCASGVCELVVCEGSAADPMPCEPDASGQCKPAAPASECWGYCKDPGPQQCGPQGECPAGYTCGCGYPDWYAGAEAPSGIACFPTCIKDEPICSSDYDCGAGQACVNGMCQSAGGECQSNSDCGADQRCELGPCPLGPCTYDPATGESWCPPCYGQCVDNGGGTCSTDAECAAGQFCAIEYCMTACPMCVPGAACLPCETQCFGGCKDQQWPQECDTSADCDSGESCQCTSNPACPECDACFFQCLPNTDPGECTSDSDCGAGQQCDFLCALCAAPQEGMPPVECPCFGMCVDKPDPTVPCADDGSCPAGMACAGAQCVPIDPPATECDVDTDCDDGYYCEQGPCAFFMPCSPDTGCPGCGGTCQKKEPMPNPCMRTGCSGQVCAAAPVMTTCEYNPSYACYALAECGLNADGVCGWKGNDAFSACLQGWTASGGVPR